MEGVGGVGSVGEVGAVGCGNASSEGEHAEPSDARSTQAARHIMTISLDRRVSRIAPPLLAPD